MKLIGNAFEFWPQGTKNLAPIAFYYPKIKSPNYQGNGVVSGRPYLAWNLADAG